MRALTADSRPRSPSRPAPAVHAAVRSASKLGPLVRLPGAAERLRVFQGCDLTVPGSFDRAIQDCVCVIHTASPFALNVK